jgi:hypothetical protein
LTRSIFEDQCSIRFPRPRRCKIRQGLSSSRSHSTETGLQIYIIVGITPGVFIDGASSHNSDSPRKSQITHNRIRMTHTPTPARPCCFHRPRYQALSLLLAQSPTPAVHSPGQSPSYPRWVSTSNSRTSTGPLRSTR